jgi:C4-dicarboxylate-specific signal transduction histidine kinase
MKLSTRLLLPLLAAVTGVMLVYALLAARQREATLTEQARNEARASSVPLGLALESAFRSVGRRDVQEIIDRLSRESTIYGVLIYGEDGRPEFLTERLRVSDAAPAEHITSALELGEPAEFERDIRGEHVFSVLKPIRDAVGKVVGAYEVTQPLSFLHAEITRTRQLYLIATATLLLSVTLIILLLARRLVAIPLERLITGVRALAAGELGHRVGADPGATELAQLADEFNRMADRLQIARGELLHEAEERVLLERRLLETEKLAVVGNIAAGLAHEVGAPLHVIRGRAELMLRRDDLGDAERRNLRIIVEQIARITRIVRNLLDFARRREPRNESVDVASSLRGVAEFLEEEFERVRITLVWHGAQSAWVRGDPNLLHQVFINLLVNAVHALEHVDGERRITISIREESERVVIEIADSGPGIPSDLIGQVFEPFVTTKASGEGTGLGLAVARSMVEDLGGSVEAVNVPTGGALFRVALQTAPAPVTADA